MRRLARLKLLMEGTVVQRQAAHTLKCMQTLTRVQSQIRSRRIRMSEENQARHKQLLHKHAKELGALKVSLLYIPPSPRCNSHSPLKSFIRSCEYIRLWNLFWYIPNPKTCSFFSRVGVIGTTAISPRSKSKQVCWISTRRRWEEKGL